MFSKYSNFTDDSEGILYGKVGDPGLLRVFDTFSDNLRDNYRNSIQPNRFKTMGRLGRYRLYDFEAVGGKIREGYRQVDKSNSKLTDMLILAKREGYEKADLPLPINQISKLIGVWHGPEKRDFNKSKYENDILTMGFLNQCRYDLKEKSNLKQTRIFSGSWSHNNQNLIDMCTPPKAKVSTDILIESMLSRVNIDFELPYIGLFDNEMILGVPTNPKSTSGLVTATKVSRKRKLSIKYTKHPAYVYSNLISNSERQVLDTSLYCVGGREKRISYSDTTNKKLKTRAVFMQEDVPTLIGQGMASIINKEIQRHNKGHNWGGRINGRKNWHQILDTMNIGDLENWVNVSVDFSGHDNHTTEEQIVVAWAFLRTMFHESVELDRLFYYSMSSMISKRVVLPESNLIYQITKGIPSGHAFTSQITTLCAYNILALSLMKTVKEDDLKYTRINNAGDDSNLRVPSYSLGRIDDYINKETPMVVDCFKDCSGLFDTNDMELMNTFLKKKYVNNEFSWNDVELFINLANPTMKGKGFGTRVDNLRQMILQAPLDFSLNKDIGVLIIGLYFERFWKKSKRYLKTKFLDNLHPFNWFKHYSRNRYKSLIELIESYDYSPNIRTEFLDSGRFVKADFREYLLGQAIRLEKDTNKKIHWFLAERPFIMHESTHRVGAFDAGKITLTPFYYKTSDESTFIYDVFGRLR